MTLITQLNSHFSLQSLSSQKTQISPHQAHLSLRVWMDPSSAQHQQIPSQSLETMLASPNQAQNNNQERKPRPQPEQALKCPRCDSTNTKFCYYNNYSLSQPRYFCKSCRRYWTKGGTLRNVPVGGGCRKNKRSSSSSSASSKRAQDQSLTPNSNPLITTFPPLSYDQNDLTLALARLHKQQFGFDDFSVLGNSLGNVSSTNTGFLDALRCGFLETQNSTNLQNLYYGYGNGDLGEVDNGSNSNNNGCGINGEMMFPFEQEASKIDTSHQAAVTATTLKQEICNNGREQGGETKVLFGHPWQLNNGDTNMSEIDSGRSNWNSLTSSPWHGLLNSPLM